MEKSSIITLKQQQAGAQSFNNDNQVNIEQLDNKLKAIQNAIDLLNSLSNTMADNPYGI